ncbi:probable serine/threonine-protein kinase clkA [Xenia sp. Carnegie-2017]|uniref:probable serine/threonine-protein kinase clkA n=1 Tax=Xenia sp. Carnegie-2017 TaxID=2897299 RepID=UPI001F03E873|nr:probable serine/threonine-protein kinase clkA [Xenia sp. Carnegie-2017]
MTSTTQGEEETYTYANYEEENKTQSRACEQPAGDSNNKHNIKTTKFERPLTHQTANKDNYTPLMKNRTSRDPNSHYYQHLQKESIQINGNNSMLSLSHGNKQPNQSVEPECISDFVISNDAGTSVYSKKQPKPEKRTSYTGKYAISNDIEYTTIARNNNTNNTVRKVANSNDEDPFQFVESNVHGYEPLMKNRRSSDHYYQHLQ